MDIRRHSPWLALVVLAAISTVGFIDRIVVNVLVEPVKTEFGLTDSQVSGCKCDSRADSRASLRYGVSIINCVWFARCDNDSSSRMRSTLLVGGAAGCASNSLTRCSSCSIR